MLETNNGKVGRKKLSKKRKNQKSRDNNKKAKS